MYTTYTRYTHLYAMLSSDPATDTPPDGAGELLWLLAHGADKQIIIDW